MALRVVTKDRLGPVRRVAGADVAYDRTGTTLCAAVVTLSYPDLQLLDTSRVCAAVRFAYTPSLLAFREAPSILEALAGLGSTPDLLFVEGHGTAHPRRFGSACHVGVLADLPTVGVAKTRLVGRHEPVPEAKGSWVPLTDRGAMVGGVLRTRSGVRPVYVSPGHRVGLFTAIRFVLHCAVRYRLPEPIRLAHRLAREEITVGPNERPSRSRENGNG